MTPGLDRRRALQLDHTVVGIDFLFVDNTNQTDLYVHFVFPPSAAQQAQLTAARVSITATAGDAPPVAVRTVDFPVVSGELVMRIRTAVPGTFTQYTLALADPPAGPQILDPYLARIEFSFKAGAATLSQSDTGLCMNGQNAPQGPVSVINTQQRVKTR